MGVKTRRPTWLGSAQVGRRVARARACQLVGSTLADVRSPAGTSCRSRIVAKTTGVGFIDGIGMLASRDEMPRARRGMPTLLAAGAVVKWADDTVL
jgi:hypothetical protein